MSSVRTLVSLALLSHAIAAVPSKIEARTESSTDGYIRFPVQYVENIPVSAPVKRQNSVIVDNKSTGTFYQVTLNIGSNSQPVGVVLDSGSSELWVNPTCSTVQSSSQRQYCNTLPRYSPTTSSSSKNLNQSMSIRYGKGSMQGVYFTDDIKAGSAVVKQQQFAISTSSSQIPAGILGVGPRTPRFQYPTLLENMALQKQINSAAFSLDLRGNASPTGSIIFGGLDTRKYQCQLERLNILTPSQVPDGLPRYMVYMTGVGQSVPGRTAKTYDNTTWNVSGGSSGLPVLLDSGATNSYLPPSLIDAIGMDYPGSQLDVESGLYVVPCKAPTGTIDFTFGKKTIKVPYSEFIWHVPSSTLCVLGMMPETETDGIFILGDSFLRAAYAVFDVDNQNIWLDQADECGSNVVAIGSGTSSVPILPGCKCGGSSTTLSSNPTGAASSSTGAKTAGASSSFKSNYGVAMICLTLALFALA